eukprot:CAMPEP_0173404210 /NCGR_PEP_ID=MMETSP1356-20130122/58802_1 /TAXON_ID=77927 ORGANISM="Hemiselmis virescens, Strain PCC157" /NCGR_SAMPLE_ID=MMETSP1356 /ASSEMBLY_ACC=CAM_ASM_000847 /LENGTH=124 /DNA_ID=CAMNT_0014364849 /DNA_START=103 /DNA_END=474 /DNA_ORIENTATION=+
MAKGRARAMGHAGLALLCMAVLAVLAAHGGDAQSLPQQGQVSLQGLTRELDSISLNQNGYGQNGQLQGLASANGAMDNGEQFLLGNQLSSVGTAQNQFTGTQSLEDAPAAEAAASEAAASEAPA